MKNELIFYSVDKVKRDENALAVLLYINHHHGKTGLEIKKNLEFEDEEGNNLLLALDEGVFIRPNPTWRTINNTKFVLAENGFFVLNELKAENPILFEQIKKNL